MIIILTTIVPVIFSSMVSSVRQRSSETSHNVSLGLFAQDCLQDAWSYRWAVETFVTNNLKRRYRRSVLGFLWSLISPLLTMSIMAVVFSLLFHADIKSYTIYIFTGLLPWAFMTDSAVEGSLCFVNAEAYLKKLYIPKIFFPLVSVGTDTMNFLFSLTSLIIIALLCSLQVHWPILWLPVIIALTAIFNIGVSLIFGIATVYLRDLTHILRILYQAMFYLVPIIYPLDRIPQAYQHWFLLNPFYYIVTPYRRVIYEGIPPHGREWAILITMAFTTLAIGLFLLRKKQDDLIYRL